MQGASPLASPGLNGARHWFFLWKAGSFGYHSGARDSKPCRLGCGTGKQCRQPRRGGTGGEELRRLRWSSPPGLGEQVPHRVQPPLRAPQRQSKQVPQGGKPPLRFPQRQGQPVPPEAKAHTTTIFSLPPAVAAQGKPRRRRAERREQTEQYAGEH